MADEELNGELEVIEDTPEPVINSTIDYSHDGRFKYYYQNGVLSRQDGPAIESNDYQVYYEDGLKHRVREPAVILSNGYRAYYYEDERHRDNGPAIIGADGYTAYYHHGKLHNLHGPAVIDPYYGDKEYWIDGVEYKNDKKWNEARKVLNGDKNGDKKTIAKSKDKAKAKDDETKVDTIDLTK